MKQKTKTKPDILESASIHKEAISNGFDHFLKSPFNVVDKYKTLSNEEIIQDLRQTAFPYAVCFENVIGDFNMSSGIRNANAFNAKEIFYVGNKRYDKRGATGCFYYSKVSWIENLEDLKKLKKDYKFVGMDNVSGSVPMKTYQYEPNTMFIFGSESCGITPALLELCDDIVHIEQYGSVRSINIASAAAITFFDYTTKFRK